MISTRVAEEPGLHPGAGIVDVGEKIVIIQNSSPILEPKQPVLGEEPLILNVSSQQKSELKNSDNIKTRLKKSMSISLIISPMDHYNLVSQISLFIKSSLKDSKFP